VHTRVISTIATVAVVIAVTAVPSAAQSPASKDFDLSASALYDVALNEYSEASNVGLHFDIAKRFLEGDKLSAAGVGEIGFNHFESFTVSNYLGGLRFAGRYSEKFAPFVQFLLGVENASDSTHFAVQTGGGVDLPWKPQFAVRAQIDWRHVDGDSDDADGFRVGVGLVFPLGR
jgi:hypothetical protein